MGSRNLSGQIELGIPRRLPNGIDGIYFRTFKFYCVSISVLSIWKRKVQENIGLHFPASGLSTCAFHELFVRFSCAPPWLYRGILTALTKIMSFCVITKYRSFFRKTKNALLPIIYYLLPLSMIHVNKFIL